MGPVWVTSDTQAAHTPTAIALGNFDGLHLGHQAVIGALDQAPVHLHRSVVTFNPHPQAFFSGVSRPLLTPVPEKVQVLEHLGLAQLIRLPFTPALARLSPSQFVRDILVEQLQAQFIAVGFNFGFGHQRSGTASDLQTLAAQFEIPVVIVAPQRFGPERISSSIIRQALTEGNIALATKLLGRPYVLQGEVIPGQQLGHTLGFPTANLKLPADKFLPRQGVYVVEVGLEPGQFLGPGVLNLGTRPTVAGQTLSAEVHLLDWQGELYGQQLCVSLCHYLRPEQRFASLADLQAQIHQDCRRARHWHQTQAQTPVEILGHEGS